MKGCNETDEHLERLWYMQEEGSDSLAALESAMKEKYSAETIEDLLCDGHVDITLEKGTITLTDSGEEIARRLIRAHRIAERMVYDVLGGDFETGACEFEHVVNQALVDSICILLGHPTECPHGMPIPPGDCCRERTELARSPVVSLTTLKVGQAARVAYVVTQSDEQLHKLDGFHVRPGAIIRLHQTYPAFVIECEGAHIAVDEPVAASISVWKPHDSDDL